MTGDGIVLRAITEPEYDRFRDSLSLVFGIDPSEESRARLKRWIELDRTIAAFDGDHIVATGGALTYRLVVPGGALVGAAGVTVVSVNPTHRRRGILTRMMRQQLEDIRDRGEPVAILRASESGIYGRFGYGCAVHAADLTIDRHRGTIRTDAPEPTGRVRLVPVDEARTVFPVVYRTASVDRLIPGAIERRPADWEGYFEDPEAEREGASSARLALYESEAGTPTGYARYRHKPSWGPGGPDGTVLVSDIQAVDAEALAALLRFLSSIDLTIKVEFDMMPLDSGIADLLADPRQLRSSTYDLLWVRLVDVVAALEARRYRREGSVVVEVLDSFLPGSGGRFRLEGGPSGAACVRTDEPAQVRLQAGDLAASYLGGSRLRTLAWLGRVVGETETIGLLDDMLSWPVPPATSVRF
jgi:predicted acetyltransferase